MRRKIFTGVFLLIGLALVAGLIYILRDNSLGVLDPKGMIAAQQRDLLMIATILMLPVVIPVFIMTFYITWKYRSSNTRAKYDPEWDHNRRAEIVWWGFPLLIIAALSVVIWKSSHELDPYKPIVSDLRPVTIQVVALPWKWLFIYPDHNIATVNYIRFPVGRPVNFEITSDAPMNSFWIPQLGGQVYAMAGMKTKLHLMASENGTYDGSSANLSGEGFAEMRFTAEAVSDKDYLAWIAHVKSGRAVLDTKQYSVISQPGTKVIADRYANADPDLYDTIIMKYMKPAEGAQASGSHSAGGH